MVGKSLQLPVVDYPNLNLTLWYIVFVHHQNDVCENCIGSLYVGGYCGLSEELKIVSSRLSCSL